MPNPLNLQDVIEYVENNISVFHKKRLEKLETLRLQKALCRKNPYLFRAKHILTAEGLVRGVLDAFLSSQEETLFGDFLEGVAVFVCHKVYDGIKPLAVDLEGIDLVFENDNKIFVVEVKSGPNWGNSSQLKKMLLNFQNAKTILAQVYPQKEIVAVNGCCYGIETNPSQKNGAYFKICGQDFWRFISDNDDLYTEIIEPLAHQAKRYNDNFHEAYAMIVNRFTHQFIEEYCFPNGMIDWVKLVEWVSKRPHNKPYPL